MATLFVENLTVLDFSYLHAKRGMVGQSWLVDIELSGELNEHKMVFDFSLVKKLVKKTIDEAVDHRLLMATENEQGTATIKDNVISLEWRYAGGVIRMKAPAQSVLLLPALDVSKGAVTHYLTELIKTVLPSNITGIVIRLHEENLGTSPCFHYSHGLRHHDGNCQRIAHGHRSRIYIEENGRRSRYWEKLWSDRWEDIYLGSHDDLEGTYLINDIPHHRFMYEASQGKFELTIPEDHCYLLNTDTTVELLAEHLAQSMASEAIASSFTVHAYEGVGKGAIAKAGQSKFR